MDARRGNGMGVTGCRGRGELMAQLYSPGREDAVAEVRRAIVAKAGRLTCMAVMLNLPNKMVAWRVVEHAGLREYRLAVRALAVSRGYRNHRSGFGSTGWLRGYQARACCSAP